MEKEKDDSISFFISKEEMENFYNKSFEDGNKLYEMNDASIQKYYTDLDDGLSDLANSIYKEGTKLRFAYKVLQFRCKKDSFIDTIFCLNLNINDTNNLYLKTYDNTIEEFNILNNLVGAIRHLLKTRESSCTKDFLNNIYAFFTLCSMIFSNIAIKFNDNIDVLNYYERGIDYIAKHSINISLQFAYLVDKFNSLKVIDEVREYFKSNFGEDYYVLKKIF